MTESSSPPPATGPLAHELRRALRDLMRLHALRDRVRAGARGLTASGAHAMELLAERGALSLNALARELCVDKSTASRTVGLLEDRGQVVRLADPRDGRAIRVELTAAGRALEARLRHDAVAETEAALSGFSPEEREEALALLRHLTRASVARGDATNELIDQLEDV